MQNDVQSNDQGESSAIFNFSVEDTLVKQELKSMSQPSNFKYRVKEAHSDRKIVLSTSGEYESNLIQLQVNELLAEIQPSYDSQLKGVRDILYLLKNSIEKIEAREPQSVPEATRSLQEVYNINIPYPDPKPQDNVAYKLAYQRPASINVVGSYTLKTMIKTKSALGIDMIVVMPESIFQKKDFLNYRYFYKRAYYLACITAGLESSFSKEFTFRFECLHGNNLHPILIVTPKLTSSTSNHPFEIYIIPAASRTLFFQPKLRPDKKSIRSNNPNPESEPSPATPLYNSSISSDCNFESYLKLLHATSKSCQGFRDSCILGRIWLRQRGFNSDMCGGGFGHFEWAAISALLLKGGGPKDQPIISTAYNCHQMFKSFLQFLSMNNMASKPFVFQKHDINLQISNSPLFYDGPREHNLLYKMSPWSYNLLLLEAKSTLDMICDEKFDHFDSTFIVNASRPLLRFDNTFSLSLKSKSSKVESCDHISITGKHTTRLHKVLKKGLTDRVKLIHIKEHSLTSWSIRSPGPSLHDDSIDVSVIFDPMKVDRLVDHGPSAEDDNKAASFRKFWGSKSELRRFKDGSILETLVWNHDSTSSVFENIVRYLIERHWNPETAKSLKFIGGQIERFFPGTVNNLQPFEALRKAFKSLESQIRDLDCLPLQLKQLSAIDAQLRYASIESPSFGPGRPMRNPASVLIEFEGSGRWPDDIFAIQRCKVAFLLRIGDILERSDEIISTRLGLENESRSLQNFAFLDVIYRSGPVFRLRICSDREQTLLQRLIKDKSIEQHLLEESVSALSIYKRVCIQLPLLSQSISIHCTRFPLLSASIRLIKFWFNRQMLFRHIGEEIIELIVVRTFLQPYPWQTPSSLMVAFLRTLLFLSRWDWKSTPLIVDFSGTMTKMQVKSINIQLESWRKIDPALNRTVLFAASNHDLSGTAFSAQGPSKMIAARMTALARSACKLISDTEYKPELISVFTASITEYDFLIHLSHKFISKLESTSQSLPKNLEVYSEKSILKIGYNPIQLYLTELEDLYSNNIIFFHENSSGSVIAGLWNPKSLSPRSFKVNLSYSTSAVETDRTGITEIVINKASILAEVARLGGDMVSKIEMRDQA